MQQVQMAMQSQMQQQQAMMQQQQAAMAGQQGGEPQEGQADEGGQKGSPPPSEEQTPPGANDAQKAEIQINNLRKKQEWMANNYIALDKSIESNSRKISEMILKRHKEMVDKHLSSWEKRQKMRLMKLQMWP